MRLRQVPGWALASEEEYSRMVVMKRSLWQPLIAVLAGNVIYWSVERFLPLYAQHQLYQTDWGLAIDFCFCLACYGLLRVIR